MSKISTEDFSTTNHKRKFLPFFSIVVFISTTFCCRFSRTLPQCGPFYSTWMLYCILKDCLANSSQVRLMTGPIWFDKLMNYCVWNNLLARPRTNRTTMVRLLCLNIKHIDIQEPTEKACSMNRNIKFIVDVLFWNSINDGFKYRSAEWKGFRWNCVRRVSQAYSR